MPPKTKAKPRSVPNSMAALRANMTKRYGDGRVSRRDTIKPYEVIPTGSMSLDLALRTGGWVRGRIHEVVGPEQQGKTTLILNSIREAQKKYPTLAAGFIDMEQTLDWDWVEKQGVNIDDSRFMHVYPDNSEDVSDQLTEMMETGLFSIIVIDSIGGMESKKAFEKGAEDVVMGKNAQVITRMVKRCAVEARKHNVAVIAVNQLRADLSGAGFDQSAGPKAFKYSTTTRVELRRTGTDALKYDFKDGEGPVVVGVETRARVTRNKVAAANKSGVFWIINQETSDWGPCGIDQAAEAYAIGVFTEVIEPQPGGFHWMPWTKDKKERLRSKGDAMTFLREHPDKAAEVRDAAVAKMAEDVIPQVLVDFEDDTMVNTQTGEVVAK